MPYIKKQDRSALGSPLSRLSQRICNEGELNYAIFYLMKEFAHCEGGSYFAHNAAIGAADCAKEEYRRRVLNPYEDRKIAENGDIL